MVEMKILICGPRLCGKSTFGRRLMNEGYVSSYTEIDVEYEKLKKRYKKKFNEIYSYIPGSNYEFERVKEEGVTEMEVDN